MSEFARRLRHTQTEAEKRLWDHLRNRQLSGHKFRRQHPIGPYTVDFCCLEKGLIVELDGGQHLEQKEKDNRRTHDLNKEGFRVLRFWDHDVLKDTEAILESLRLVLSGPHPHPLPGRERGGKSPVPACRQAGARASAGGKGDSAS